MADFELKLIEKCDIMRSKIDYLLHDIDENDYLKKMSPLKCFIENVEFSLFEIKDIIYSIERIIKLQYELDNLKNEL